MQIVNDDDFKTIVTFTPPDDQVSHVRIIGVSRRSDGANGGAWRVNYTCRVSSGVVTELGVKELSKNENNGLDFTVDTDGTVVRARGKGNSGETHDWKVWLRVWH